MYNTQQQLENLTRHISLVRDACSLLGERLIQNGEEDPGWLLIARGHEHDKSKFYGVEREFLHRGPDVPRDMLDYAISQHVRTNSHHPEFHGGIQNMPPLDVAEMVCDCYARSQEFGSDLRLWFGTEAVKKYGINKKGRQWKWIQRYLNILLINSFVRIAR